MGINHVPVTEDLVNREQYIKEVESFKIIYAVSIYVKFSKELNKNQLT